MSYLDDIAKAKEIVELIGDNEDLARQVRWELANQFGWTYAAWERTDVEAFLERPLTEAEWELVRYSKDWRDVIPEQMADGASMSFMLDILGIEA
jgi:hypothetical protein